MEYNFSAIEKRAKQYWNDNNVYKTENSTDRPKYYVLDMFPYPSGAGLHVGHPLGYIASDIFSRYKRMKGFNVLHPMGFDAFGLPAEQYALETGKHPARTTEENITRYKEQLNNIGFCYDWSREVRTSDPAYYKWTQWLFLQLFKSWYNRQTSKAEPIENLMQLFSAEGNDHHTCPGDESIRFSAEEWNAMDEKARQDILMHYRLAFSGTGEVNWCEALGTVLANDEVVNGVSERGGFPVVRKKLRQWYLRITEYADRLLEGLDTVEFSEAMKEMQRNWIGKSTGAEVRFQLQDSEAFIEVFTTRPDTIFGVDFMVLAPEHELVLTIASPAQRAAVEEYIDYVKSRSERERMAEKKISGVFTGAYVTHPFSGKSIPVWISEYVLAGYGTGAIMAVPCGDERDHKFARHFQIPVTNIIGEKYNGEDAYSEKDFTLVNSDFITGLSVKDAAEAVISKLAASGMGHRKVNFKMRDAAFSRQRYWGEPFPIRWEHGVAYPLSEEQLPLELPHIEKYGPGPEGEGPLANVPEWTAQHLETNTMPGYAGSSWYFLRYMDPENDTAFCDRKLSDYWNQVDVYVGGTEHAVGHLLYSRMWTKVMYDLGLIGFDEPFRKLVNQGMIQGVSAFLGYIGFNFQVSKNHPEYLDKEEEIEKLKNKYKAVTDYFISNDLLEKIKSVDEEYMDVFRSIISDIETEVSNEIKTRGLDEIVKVLNSPLSLNMYRTHVPIKYVNSGDEVDVENLTATEQKFSGARFKVNENGKFICAREVEKMSKGKYNVVNPDDIVAQYGADTFRMYEMFLGPIDVSKPWDTKGIEGVHRFLKKLWRLYADEQTGWVVTDEKATDAELRILHKTIKKIEEDTERFSFNTCVSQFMIAVNELSALSCHKKEILQPLALLLCPFAPHIAEELWHLLGNEGSAVQAAFPRFDAQYLIENSKLYPVAVNGKTRTEMEFSLDADLASIERAVLAEPNIARWLEGKTPKKIIYIKGKMINVVI